VNPPLFPPDPPVAVASAKPFLDAMALAVAFATPPAPPVPPPFPPTPPAALAEAFAAPLFVAFDVALVVAEPPLPPLTEAMRPAPPFALALEFAEPFRPLSAAVEVAALSPPVPTQGPPGGRPAP
jgi:hypothetical protein